MAVKALIKLSHNGVKYHCDDIISDITKEEADRLIKLNAAEMVDDKFKRSKENIKKSIMNKGKWSRRNEENFINGF